MPAVSYKSIFDNIASKAKMAVYAKPSFKLVNIRPTYLKIKRYQTNRLSHTNCGSSVYRYCLFSCN